jgi:predicted transcriptional regulator
MSAGSCIEDNRLSILGCVVNNNSISEIVERMGMEKDEVLGHIQNLFQEKMISKKQFNTYSDKPQYNYDNPVLELFRQNVPPMRIAEKVGVSRQAVYSYLSSLKKKGIVTEDEYEKRSKLWKRKHFDKFEDVEENLQLVVKTLEDNPSDTPREISEKVGIRVPLLKRVVSFLHERGDITEQEHERILDHVKLVDQERNEFVLKLCSEYTNTSFKKLAVKYGRTVRGVILLVEKGIKLGYITQEDYDAVVSSRRTNKSRLPEEKILELVEKQKMGASINSLATEYDRCSTIIRKYIDAYTADT